MMSGTSREIALTDIAAIHLDAVGGIAGDMFVAAMLNALPGLWGPCNAAIEAISPPAGVSARARPHSDNVLVGSKFGVTLPPTSFDDQRSHDHRHTSWVKIEEKLLRARLEPNTREIAIGIFQRLAAAEAKVHGIPVENVAFHEVGAWDSIIDIVASAAIISKLSLCTWTVGTLPRGRGLVQSDHGMLPVPAPAVLELLRGFEILDDGEDGERITPTGAAILNYLRPSQDADHVSRRLLGSGTGFGSRKLAHRSNILRATLLADSCSQHQSTALDRTDRVDVLRFEIDDQTPEDLAMALDRIREFSSVLDVCQWSALSKKGRMCTSVQILAMPNATRDVARLVFDETTTLGIRRYDCERLVVERRVVSTSNGDRVKVARRPAGQTAKIEQDDLSTISTARSRELKRREAERQALEGDGKND